MNDKIIYQLDKETPVIVPFIGNRANIVITDGFHFSYPYNIECNPKSIQHLKVSCTIEDEELIIGFFLILLFYAAALSSDILILKIMSFLPILQFLNQFYIRRKAFIRVWII